jgi:Ser/Thr protein kinase RdoA (MazF antagonist)
VVRAALERLGLLAPGETARFAPLPGGVSSDIWRVETGGRCFCVKRALPKLKVAQDWHAPVERSRFEQAWLAEAGRLVPDAVPHLLGFDAEANLFALEWLDPASHRWWKGELLAGRADPEVAAEAGRRLGAIHAGTAGRESIARAFATDAIFESIRLDPYLRATARVHPDLAGALHGLADTTASTRRALVHGDISPKNILLGPRGPIFIDAECAWYGDPAFDLAFCLNHLLLKCMAVPGAAADVLASFDRLAEAYLGQVDWEPRRALEVRAAHLLPGLLLARVDGKSPVEYLTSEDDKAHVRGLARSLLANPAAELAHVRAAWSEQLRK